LGARLVESLSDDLKNFVGVMSSFQTHRYSWSIQKSVGNNPLNWLKKIDYLKTLGKLTEKEMLIIAADHLVNTLMFTKSYLNSIEFHLLFQKVKKVCIMNVSKELNQIVALSMINNSLLLSIVRIYRTQISETLIIYKNNR
jgi:hypothetical protein